MVVFEDSGVSVSHQTMSISNSAKRLGRRFGVSEGKLLASEARTSLGKTGAGLGNPWDSGGGVPAVNTVRTSLLLLWRYLSFE
jgi:hypothetical protein